MGREVIMHSTLPTHEDALSGLLRVLGAPGLAVETGDSISCSATGLDQICILSKQNASISTHNA
jgi:hypothetical protein